MNVRILAVLLLLPCLATAGSIAEQKQAVETEINRQDILRALQRVDYNIRFIDDKIFYLNERKKQRPLTDQEQELMGKLVKVKTDLVKQRNILQQASDRIRAERSFDESQSKQEAIQYRALVK